MRNIEAKPDAGPAHERISEILRSALGAPKEEALEDETRRLMLRLSIEPLENAGVDPVPRPADPSPRLLRRLLGGRRTASRA